MASVWGENMLGYLSAHSTCSKKRTVLRERSSKKNASFKDETMFREELIRAYFESQTEAIVFIILQKFADMVTI